MIRSGMKFLRKGLKTCTSVLLTASVSFTTLAAYPAQTFAAENKGRYVSELIVYQGGLEDAKTKNPDYIFVEEDISEGGGSGRSTYLGYKTTDDVSLAIRDIASLQMNGNYKIADYESLVAEKKEGVKALVYSLQVAAEEFRINYKAGKQRALDAYEMLNKYYEEDTGLKMGDFFLANESQVTYENYETLYMEANSTAIVTLKQILLTAADTEDDTWIDRVAETEDFGGLVEKENKEREKQGLAPRSNKAAITYYKQLYQNLFTRFEKSWDRLREGLEKYLESGISIRDEEAEEYVDRLLDEEEDAEVQSFATYGAIYEVLETIPYEDGTMSDFFLQPFDEVDELQMYVFMDSMSEAQREIGSDIGLADLFLCAAQQSFETGDENSVIAVTEESIAEAEEETAGFQKEVTEQIDDMIDRLEQVKEIAEETVQDHAVSVYAGVDRDFMRGTVGMTSAGNKMQLSTDTPWYGSAAEMTHIYFFGAMGVSFMVTGLYCLCKGFGKLSQEVARLTEEASRTADYFLMMVEAIETEYNINIQTVRGMEFLETMPGSKAALEKLLIMNNTQEQLLDAAEDAMARMKLVGSILLVTGIAITTVSLISGIQIILNGDNPSYLEIPEKMVDSSAGKEGMQPFLNYSVVRDQNGKAADLNSYTSGTWMSLYTSRSYDAGDPILARDFGRIRKGDIGSDSLNRGFVHEFGAHSPENLLNYSKNSGEATGIYLFYTRDNGDNTGSAFGREDAKLAMTIMGAVIVFGAVAFLVLRIRRRKEQ